MTIAQDATSFACQKARSDILPLHECNGVLRKTGVIDVDLRFGHGRVGGLKVADTTCFEPQMTGEG